MSRDNDNLSDDELHALTNDELHALVNDLDGRIRLLNDDDETAAELIEQEALVRREMSRRQARETQKTARYSVVFRVEGEEIEYALKARTLADAQKEAESGAESMSRVIKINVTVDRINGPLA